ncbi:uncharacterized protein EV420DRAFT_1473523 [Desarmillaria tabescens]|uniref:Uncharacterized protein n=1 Tax=Armillaria tabescens TaxID=1929756 RepID=A0AA39NRD9_ARMTA|nr:uncharacterized protein EV420DRAFT_1473523 [Desarmillaria tabescens]KAK0470467.1 hypothetical protein EV420DRAFT_1473523 [Desarmillaria tabescens]
MPAPSDSDTALRRQGTRTSTPTSQSSEMKKMWKERFGLAESKSKTMPTEGSNPSDEEYGITETRVDLSTGGTIVGPGTHPHSTCLYLSTERGEEVVMAYHGFSPHAPDPDEIPQPEEFYSQQQHDWAIMDAWHQANRLLPLEDGEIPEFDLQYPDLSIATGRSNTVTKGGSPAPDPGEISDVDPRDTSGPDSYDSWVTDNGEHNPYTLRDEIADHHLSPYGECRGDLCCRLQAIAEDQRQDWETPKPLVPYVRWTLGEYGEEPELANFFFDNPVHSETSPMEYETRTMPSPEGEVPTYQRDKSSPYYRDPRTSPSISGLAILRPASGTAGTCGSTLPSPTTDTGSQNPTQRSPLHIPNQLPNLAMQKLVAEMGWLELLEWQGSSLANEGSWLIMEAAKFMY